MPTAPNPLILRLAGALVFSLLALPSAYPQSAGFRGVLLDPRGVTVSGATVSLYSDQRVLQTKTDSAGKFEFTNLAVGDYELEATYPRFDPIVLGKFTVKPGDAMKEIPTVTMVVPLVHGCGTDSMISYKDRVPGGPSVVGSIQTGLPPPEPNVDWRSTLPLLSDAIIEVVVVGSQSVAATTHPDADGWYQFTGLKTGKYFVRIRLPGSDEVTSSEFRVMSENTTSIATLFVATGQLVMCD